MTRARYYPPAISHNWLTNEVIAVYPGHKESRNLIEELVREYMKLWRLILSYPEKRIVGTGPIIAVQRVHWSHRKEYFDDCMDYFNRYLFREMVWGGRHDVQGTLDTVRAYQELYQEDLHLAWNDITAEYSLGHSSLRAI